MVDPILQADPNAYAAALQNSPNFLNPSYATPEQIAALRATSTALMKDQPVHNWAEGLGSLAQYGVGLYLQNKAGQQQKDAIAQQQQMLVPQSASTGGGNMLTTPPPSGDVPPASMANGGQGGAVSAYGPAVASIESKGSGDYGAIGPTIKSGSMAGQHAIGKYGIMESNVGPWTQEALGQPLTREQFLANPQAQDATFNHKFGQFVKQTGNVRDAASMWLTGRTLANGGAAAADQNGTTGQAYADRVAQASGGGGVPWPANKPAPTQVAQAGPPQGAGPLGGMGPQQIAAILANPWIDEKTKDMIRSLATPQVVGTPGGGSSVLVPGQGAKVTPAVGGVIPGSISVPGANVGTTTQLGPDGKPTTTLNVPGDGGAPGAPQSGNPLAPLAPLVKGGQGFQAAGQEQEGLVHQLGTLRDQGPSSKAALGQIDTLEQLGDKVNDSGFVPMIQSEAAKHGIQIGSNLPSIQAYEAYANSILPSMRPPGSGSLGPDIPMFQAATGNLATTPEGRHLIANNMRMLHQYNAQVAEIASQYDKTPQERWQAIQQIPVPKPITALPGQNGQGGPQTAPGTPQVAAQGGAAQPAPAPSANGPVMVRTPDEARKLAPGTVFQVPGGRTFTR